MRVFLILLLTLIFLSPVGNEEELLISLETKIMSAEYWSGVICMINVNKGE